MGTSNTKNTISYTRGVLPRACGVIFDKMKDTQKDGVLTLVHVTAVEIYIDERLVDLLDPNNVEQITIHEDPSTGVINLDNATQMAVYSFEGMMGIIENMANARSVASTLSNETSSRSHCIFTIFMEQQIPMGGTATGENELYYFALYSLAYFLLITKQQF